jgi:hypothetical protein
MKLKGLTKLVLAGTALAATAATLTTSTYAWYVVNTTVKAEGLSGATAGTNIGGSVLISYAAADTLLPVEYTTKLDFTADGKASDAELLPTTKATAPGYTKTTDADVVAGKTYYSYNEASEQYTAVASPNAAGLATYFEMAYDTGAWVDRAGKLMSVVAEGTAGQTGYKPAKVITYQFWLKASEDTTVNVKTSFTNTTAPVSPATDVLKQTFYSETGLPTGKNKNDSFAVDAVYALRMEADVTQYTITEEAYDDTTVADADEFAEKKATGKLYIKTGSEAPFTYTKVVAQTYDSSASYALDASGITKKAGTDSVKTTVGAVENHLATMGAAYTKNAYFDDFTNGDANKYFKSIMKDAGYGTDASDGHSEDAPNATWTTVSLTKDVDTLVTLTIWLEGTDAQCWDSCVGQTFKIDLTFDAQ